MDHLGLSQSRRTLVRVALERLRALQLSDSSSIKLNDQNFSGGLGRNIIQRQSAEAASGLSSGLLQVTLARQVAQTYLLLEPGQVSSMGQVEEIWGRLLHHTTGSPSGGSFDVRVMLDLLNFCHLHQDLELIQTDQWLPDPLSPVSLDGRHLRTTRTLSDRDWNEGPVRLQSLMEKISCACLKDLECLSLVPLWGRFRRLRSLTRTPCLEVCVARLTGSLSRACSMRNMSMVNSLNFT